MCLALIVKMSNPSIAAALYLLKSIVDSSTLDVQIWVLWDERVDEEEERLTN